MAQFDVYFKFSSNEIPRRKKKKKEKRKTSAQDQIRAEDFFFFFFFDAPSVTLLPKVDVKHAAVSFIYIFFRERQKKLKEETMLLDGPDCLAASNVLEGWRARRPLGCWILLGRRGDGRDTNN